MPRLRGRDSHTLRAKHAFRSPHASRTSRRVRVAVPTCPHVVRRLRPNPFGAYCESSCSPAARSPCRLQPRRFVLLLLPMRRSRPRAPKPLPPACRRQRHYTATYTATPTRPQGRPASAQRAPASARRMTSQLAPRRSRYYVCNAEGTGAWVRGAFKTHTHVSERQNCTCQSLIPPPLTSPRQRRSSQTISFVIANNNRPS